MKNLLEFHLQKLCQRHFPHIKFDGSLHYTEFADYSWYGFCRWTPKFSKDMTLFSQMVCEELLAQKGVRSVRLEKNGYLNIDVDVFIRYDLIFHRVLESPPSFLPVLSIHQPNIQYAQFRLQSILEPLSFETVPVVPQDLIIEEKRMINCLDDLLCVFKEDNIQQISKRLNDLANEIHGYLRIITLLCEDKIKYQFQIQLLKLSELLFITDTLHRNPKNHREYE